MTLLLGACLKRMSEIPAGSVDMVLCDPPYGTTACKWDSVIPFAPMWAELKRIAKPNAAIVLNCQEPFTSTLICSNLGMFRYKWVWEKNVPTGHLNANRMPMKWHEDIAVFYGKLPTYNPQLRGGAGYSVKLSNVHSQNYGKQKNVGESINDGSQYKPKDIIKFNNENGKGKLHPTQKPVALLEYLIRTYTLPSETVLDFTMGSGSTGVACVNTGRKFVGIELDANYFEIAKRRITEAQSTERLPLVTA